MASVTVAYQHPESKAVAVVRRVEHGWWLDTIRVPPRQRGRGYGSLLLDEICADADERGRAVWLAVQPEPRGLAYEELVRWYGRRGFAAIGDRLLERRPRRRREADEEASERGLDLRRGLRLDGRV